MLPKAIPYIFRHLYPPCSPNTLFLSTLSHQHRSKITRFTQHNADTIVAQTKPIAIIEYNILPQNIDIIRNKTERRKNAIVAKEIVTHLQIFLSFIMSENGVLQNIFNYLGGPDKLIPFIPADLIERATSYPYFKDITGGFLAHVLSYTTLKDTMSVILTCKSWYQASRAETFWSRRIRKKLAEYCECYCYRPKFKKAFLAFDTFKTPNSDETG